MANETITTSVDELSSIAIAEARLVASNRQDLTKLLTKRVLKPGEISARFPKYGAQTATATSQGSEVATSEITTTGTVLTPGTNATWSTVFTDQAQFSSPQAWADAGRLAANAIMKKKNADVWALFDGFSTVLGTTNTDITIALVKTAVKKLIQAGTASTPFFAFTPEVWSNLIDSLISSGNASLVSDSTKEKILNGMIDENFTLFGAIPVCVTSGIDESGDLHCGVFTREALGIAEAWDFKFEVQRRAKVIGWDVVASASYAVGEIDDSQGIEVLCDGA